MYQLYRCAKCGEAGNACQSLIGNVSTTVLMRLLQVHYTKISQKI